MNIDRYTLFLSLCLFVQSASTLGVADFVPGFMTSEPTETSDPNLPVKPLVDAKRNSSAPTKSWYCNRTQGGEVQSNVFCKDSTDEAVGKVITYDNNGAGDKSKMIDITSQDTQTTANQNSLLDQSVKNELNKSQNNFSLPIQPSKNVNMNVGQNKIDFNIKY